MNKYILAILLIAVPAWGAETIISESAIDHATYLERGNGIAYHNGSAWVRSSKTVKVSGNNFIVDEAGLTWSIAKNSRDITFTRDGIDTTFGFGGMYWFNIETEDWTAIDTPNNITPTQSGDTVLIPGLYDGVDVEIVSHVSGPQVDYIVNDMSGWMANPYGSDGVLAFWHELKSRGHGLKVDGVAWNGTDYTLGNNITLAGTVKDFDIVYSEATDANGDTFPVTNALIRAVNKDFFGESIHSTWLASATLPVRMHYTTESGTLTSSETWVEGTNIYVSANLTLGGTSQSYVIEKGVFVKFDDNVTFALAASNDLSVTGVWDDYAYFIHCGNDAYGDDFGVDPGGNCASQSTWSGLIGLVGQHQLTGMWFEDNGGAAVIDSSSCDAGQTSWIKDSVFVATEQSGGVIEYYPWACGTSTLNIENNIIDQNGGGTGAIYIRNINTVGDVVTFKNNLVIDEDSLYVLFMRDFATTIPDTLYVTNNTIICESSSTHGYINVTSDTDVMVDGNIVTGCNEGYSGCGGAQCPKNLGYNNTDDFVSWTGGATEITTTPDHQTHLDDSVPVWADDFHLGTSSNGIDAGSDLAASFGLDDRHALDTGADDTGTVDMGFHYPTAAGEPPATRRIIITKWLNR